MARQFIPDVYERLKVGDGVDANSIVGVIPQANLPPEAPPQPVQQYQLPDDLQHLEREVAFDEATVGSPVWRLGNDSPGITLANTYRFLFTALTANTSVPNEITLGTGITAAAPATSIRLDPARFRPGSATNYLTITQPNDSNEFVISFEFQFTPRLVSTQPILQIKDNGSNTYHNVIGIGANGIEYARAAPGDLVTFTGNRALALAGWYRYVVHFKDVPNIEPTTRDTIPNILEITEVLYDYDNIDVNTPQLVQNQRITTGYSGPGEYDYTSIRLAGQSFEFHDISGWQYDAGATNTVSLTNLVDWVEHHWDEPLGGRVRAPDVHDIERIRFLESLEAPRLFIGDTEVTAASTLTAAQAAKLQGDILTAISINGPNLLIATVEANGNIGSETIALSSLVQDDSIGVDELDDTLVARFLPTGGTDGQIIKRVSGVPAWADEAAGGSADTEVLVDWEPTTAFPVGDPSGGGYQFKEFPAATAFSRALTSADDNSLLAFQLYGDNINSAAATVLREIATPIIIPASDWRTAASIADDVLSTATGKDMWFCPIIYQNSEGWRRGFIGKGTNGRPGGIWQSAGSDAQRTPRVTGLKVTLITGSGGSGAVGGQQDGQQVGGGEVRDGTLDLGDFNPLDRAIIDPNYDLRADSTYGVLEAAVGSIHTGLVVENAVRHVSANVSNLVAAAIPVIYDRSVNDPAPTTNTAFKKGISFPEDPDRTGGTLTTQGFMIRDITPMNVGIQWIGAVTFKPANLDADRVLASFGRTGSNHQINIVLTSGGNVVEIRNNTNTRIANAFVSGLSIAAGSWNVLSFLMTNQAAAGSVRLDISVNGRAGTGTTIGQSALTDAEAIAFGNGLERQSLGETFRGVMYDAWVTRTTTNQGTDVLTGISSSPIGVRAGTANTDSVRNSPYGIGIGTLAGVSGRGEYTYQPRLLRNVVASRYWTIDLTDGATVNLIPSIDLNETESVLFEFSPDGTAWYQVEVPAHIIPRKTLANQFVVDSATQARFVWQQDGIQTLISGPPYSTAFNQFQMAFVIDSGTNAASRFNIWPNQSQAISIRPTTNIRIRNFRVRPNTI